MEREAREGKRVCVVGGRKKIFWPRKERKPQTRAEGEQREGAKAECLGVKVSETEKGPGFFFYSTSYKRHMQSRHHNGGAEGTRVDCSPVNSLVDFLQPKSLVLAHIESEQACIHKAKERGRVGAVVHELALDRDIVQHDVRIRELN